MKKLLWFAALVTLGCTGTVKQAPSAGLPEVRPGKQHHEKAAYPPPSSDEDLPESGNGPTAQDYTFKVDYSSWPGVWLMSGPEDGVVKAVNLETECQATIVLEFKARGTAKQQAAAIRDDVLKPRAENLSPISVSPAGTEASLVFKLHRPPAFGRFVLRTYPSLASGLSASSLILCPLNQREAVQPVSEAVMSSISVVRSDEDKE